MPPPLAFFCALMLGTTFFKTWHFRWMWLKAKMVAAMRGRGNRFNGILVRFNKKAMLNMCLGPVFSLSRANITEPLLFIPFNSSSQRCMAYSVL